MIAEAVKGAEWVGPLVVIAVLLFVLLEIRFSWKGHRKKYFDTKGVAELVAKRLGVLVVPCEELTWDASGVCRSRTVEKDPNRVLACGSTGNIFRGDMITMLPVVIWVAGGRGSGAISIVVDELLRRLQRATKNPAPVLSYDGEALLLYYAVERPKEDPVDLELGRPRLEVPRETLAFLEYLNTLEVSEIPVVLAQVEKEMPDFYGTIEKRAKRIQFIRNLGYLTARV